jgi:hypothetical protein
VRKHMGKKHKFSYGDYVVKCMLGPMDKELDNLDGSGGFLSKLF